MSEEVDNNLIRKLNQDKNHTFFPKQFSNEVYYSNTHGFEPFRYTTNLTIKFVNRGYDYYKVNGKEHKLLKNQYLIINNGNDVECYSDKRAEGFSVFMDSSILNEIRVPIVKSMDMVGMPMNGNEVIELPQYCNDQLGHYLINLFFAARTHLRLDEFTKHETFFYDIAELISSTNQETLSRIKAIKRNDPSIKIELYKRLGMALEYLEGNYKIHVSLQNLAETACISKYYLIKLFKMVYGTTPYDYLLRKRIEHSKILLQQSNDSIAEISSLTGFNDAASFSKKFKKSTGFSPTQFRSKKSNF